MKKSLRFIALILTAVFLISGTMMVVCYAAPEDGGEVFGDGGDQTGGEQTGGEQTGGEQTGGDQTGGDQTGGDQTGDEQTGGEQTGGEQTPIDNGQVSGNDGQGSYEDNEYYNNNDYSVNNYVEDDEPLYYGDASNYDYNTFDNSDSTAGAVSSQTTLYSTSGMSAADAAPNEWSDIVLDEKTVKTGVADFSAIKSNTETKDDGDWILYLGYALIGLSVLGILYFIIATITHRKAMQKAERMERRRGNSPARSEAARMEERERRESGSYHRTSRFTDDAPSYSRRVSSKADTGEVYIPRRAAKKSR